MKETTIDKTIDKILDSKDKEKDALQYLKEFRGKDMFVDYPVLSFEDMLLFFAKDSVANFEVTDYSVVSRKNDWANHFASSHLKGKYISPSKLEPFVARYVLAINSVGAKTNFSCDGWHKKTKNEWSVAFVERNSALWHKIIFEYVCSTLHIQLKMNFDKNFAFVTLPPSDDKKICEYIKINKIAEYIEKNQSLFLNAKSKMIEKLKNLPKNCLSDEDLYFLMKKTIKDENLF